MTGLVLLLCVPCILCLLCLGGKRGCVRKRPRLPDPRPLPTHRIDIRQNKITAQTRSCHLLNLPAELRQLIFEMALGRRVVKLKLVPNKQYNRLAIKTTCHRPSAAPGIPNDFHDPADKIPVALLLSCRQVYLEGLPLMHQRNTFYFDVEDFQAAVLCGLGLYCLPDIRSVHLYHSWHYARWDAACCLLKKTGLDRLTLEFEIVEWTALDPSIYTVDNDWCRSLLGIRGLRTLDLFFRSGNPSEHPMHRETVQKQFRELMIGPGADERYSAFLAGQRLREQKKAAEVTMMK
ncbi:hypothetical protein B0H10DRAFT_1944688 [Mycena sp. CBHHK59/15]|nr:hypothetical protein B0H10DRAFT_1944688 [Mycena sp. CBHHK59/15]